MVQASLVRDGYLKPHNCGFYLQTMPIDHETGLAAIPYQEAETLGFVKIDFLHLSLLDVIESKAEVRALAKKEPNWRLMLDKSVVEKLFQLGRHHDLLKRVRPASVDQIADCIALIRPGKKHLIDKYVEANDSLAMRAELYAKTHLPYYKRSHAIAYALNIVMQLNLIELGVL